MPGGYNELLVQTFQIDFMSEIFMWIKVNLLHIDIAEYETEQKCVISTLNFLHSGSRAKESLCGARYICINAFHYGQNL